MVNALIYLPLTIWLMVVPYTGQSAKGRCRAARCVGAMPPM